MKQVKLCLFHVDALQFCMKKAPSVQKYVVSVKKESANKNYMNFKNVGHVLARSWHHF